MIALLAVPKIAVVGVLAFVLLLSPLTAVVTREEIDAAMADKEFLFEICEATGRGVIGDLWRTWNDTDDGLTVEEVVIKALREYKMGRGSTMVRGVIREHLRRRSFR